jgi:tripartite-type tricarboxylate transporter receptor subunit TctC
MFLRKALICLLCPLWLAPATAGTAWPERHVTMVVPFPAGTSPDLMARIVGEPLARALGQPVVIENKPGAGGNIGTARVARAEPDGYTILFTINGPLTTAPTLYKNLGYEPFTDLAPVTLVATSPNVLVVAPGLGAGTVKDLVALARAKPAALNYGSVGAGSASQLAMEMFKSEARIDLVHVPYAGFPAATAAIVSGQIQAAFMVPGIAMPQVKSGKIKALAVTTLERAAALPGIPTMAEQGYPEFEANSWQAILAPARAPKPILERLNAELLKIIAAAETRAKMTTLYFEPAGTTPEALASLMKKEQARWGKVIRALKLQVD